MSKGLIMGVFSLLAFIAGIAAAIKLSAIVSQWLDANTGIGTIWLPVISFAVVFIGVVLLVKWGAGMIENIVDFAMLGWINKIGGALMYIMLYGFLISVALFYLSKSGIISEDQIAASRLFPVLQPMGPWVIDGIGLIIPIFKDLFQQLTDFFERIKTTPA